MNLENRQAWHDTMTAEIHGKPNQRSNNTAHYARKTRTMITQREIYGQRVVKSLPSIGYSHPTCQMNKQTSRPSKAYRLRIVSQYSITQNLLTKSKIFYSHREYVY